MSSEILEAIGSAFPLKQRDAGEFAHFRAAPLTVSLDWYAAEGLGSVSLLRSKAMAGLMRMETLVIDPFERDVPLFSYDSIDAAGRQTLLVEYYDTLLSPEAFNTAPLMCVKRDASALPDHDLGAHWYDSMKLPASFAKRAGKRALPLFHTAFLSALRSFLSLAAEAPVLSETAQAEKRQKAAAYVNGLLQNGGPCTDAFVKAIGAERTRKLFAGMVFGTETLV